MLSSERCNLVSILQIFKKAEVGFTSKQNSACIPPRTELRRFGLRTLHNPDTHTHCPLSGSSKQLVCFSVCFRRCALATGPLSGNQISGARLSHHFSKQTSTLTYTLSAAQNFAAREGQFFHLRALLTHLAQRALHPSTLVVQLRRICGLVSPVAKL